MSESKAARCIVCLEAFAVTNANGISCPNDHFLCQSDLVSYLAENVFPAVFRLRESRCAISCPADNCPCSFNSLHLFRFMPPRERARYMSLITDVVSGISRFRMLRSAILDVMTLKCPSCKTPVDPFPDACSAVMCLNCGHHYCNFCFQGFASGITEQDRAAAHEHVASHSLADRPESRDAFLSAEHVASGQRLHQIAQLEKCVSLAISSPEYGSDGSHDVALTLIWCHKELQDLKIDPNELWTSSQNTIILQMQARRARMMSATGTGKPNRNLTSIEPHLTLSPSFNLLLYLFNEIIL